MTGRPSINVPCGMEDDLPIGMMVIGRRYDELTVLQISDTFERIGDWRDM